jgi:hypothetical protein
LGPGEFSEGDGRGQEVTDEFNEECRFLDGRIQFSEEWWGLIRNKRELGGIMYIVLEGMVELIKKCRVKDGMEEFSEEW